MSRGSAARPHDRVVVLGSGAWGTTLALLADRAGCAVSLVVRGDSARREMREERRHPRSLPGVLLPQSIRIEAEAAPAAQEAGMVMLAVPAQQLRAALMPLGPVLRGQLIVSATKGIEVATLKRPSEVIIDVVGDAAGPIAALSGPNLASEIAAGKPATTVVAAADAGVAAVVQQALMSDEFRVYTSNDVAGVEYGGALKNIVAIGAGIGDGLNSGDNAKAAFLTRGIAEISRLGVALGADPLTFAGLSGIGDLLATCASPLSRNHRVGVELAAGKTLREIIAGMSEVAEGIETT